VSSATDSGVGVGVRHPDRLEVHRRGTQSGGADLELIRLSKQFGDVTAVDDIDLMIPAGSFFALLGPSGCGKTTTLRMVAGLEDPTAGTIRIGRQDLTMTPPHRRPVNTVFQSYALFPHLSVVDNVAFGLRRRRQAHATQRAMEALELVELAHCANRRPNQLSGGQQQRVALARAIVNRPAVLLLDEPLGALDLKLRRQMQVELKRIQLDVGLTFVHVTHDQEEAMTMADTVAVMNAGRIEQLGAPAELYEQPRTAFVANFLGQSNLVAGVLDLPRGSRELAAVVLPVGSDRPLWVSRPRVSASGGRVLVGVRPEKVYLVPGDGTGQGDEDIPGSVNVLGPGRVRDVSFAGVSTQYLVDVPGLETLTVFSQNLERSRARVGDLVRLAWAPQHTFALAGDQDAHAGLDED
jgi:spermidine/putrescine transport system ATP-binding protein